MFICSCLINIQIIIELTQLCFTYFVFKANPTGLNGTLVDFLIVIEALPSSLANIMLELNIINDNLGMDQGNEGIDFVGSLLEGKSKQD